MVGLREISFCIMRSKSKLKPFSIFNVEISIYCNAEANSMSKIELSAKTIESIEKLPYFGKNQDKFVYELLVALQNSNR